MNHLYSFRKWIVTSIFLSLWLFSNAQTTPTFAVTQSTGTVGQGTKYQQIIRVQLKTGSRDLINSVSFRLIGKDNIKSVRLYNGGGTNAYNVFMGLFGSELSGFTNDTIKFIPTGNETYDLTNDVYLYLVLEIKPDATVGQTVDAECLSTIIRNTWSLKLTTTGNPNGARKIVAPMTGIYTIKSPAGGTTNFTKLSAAIDTLNRWGCTGGVTFLLEDDSTFAENFSTKYIYQTGSAGNLITFKRSGTGTNLPLVKPAGTSGPDDAGFTFWGTDFVLIDGIQINGPTITGNKVDFGVRLRNAKDDGCKNITIQNCNIQLDSAYDTRAIYANRNALPISTDGNNDKLKILNNIIKNARMGIYINDGASFSPFQEDSVIISGNTVSSISINNDQSAIYARDIKNLIVSNNEVKDYKLGPSYGGWVRGIDVGATVLKVFSNKIHGITNPGTANNSRAIGIIAYGQYNYVYNNMVWDINTTPASTVGNDGEVVRGISVQGYNNIGYCYVYNNTVSLKVATSTTLRHRLSAIQIENNITTCELKNNIMINRSTGFTGFKNSALYYNADFARTMVASDNNIYYVGTATNADSVVILYNNGGSSYQSLKAFRQAGFNKDIHSQYENVPFVSADDIHLRTDVATWAEKGGIPVSIVANDIDGEPRDASKPDVGADEGNFLISVKDTIGPDIVFTPLQSTSSTANPVLVVTINDTSKVDSGLFMPRLWYRNTTNSSTTWANIPANPNTAATNGWKWAKASKSGNQYTFTINYAILNGGIPKPGQTIEYFIAAQDYHVGPNLSISPAVGGYTATNDTNFSGNPPSSRYSYKILKATPMSGDYKVGTGQFFPTLAKATATLDSSGISGPVRLLLTDATYALAASTVQFNQVPGMSKTNTITLKPFTGVKAKITYAPTGGNSAAIVLNGADYFTIDGSNTVGGTTRDLTIETTANQTGAIINIRSLGTGLGANCDTIKNCWLRGPGIGTSDIRGIASGGTQVSSGDDNDSLVIQNNLITNVRYGIYAMGNQTGVHDYLRIIGNTLDTLARSGIELQRVNDVVVDKNIIRNIATGGETNDRAAIYLMTNVTNAVVSNNVIDSIYKTANVNNAIVGIYVTPGNMNANIKIFNNMITRVLGMHSTGIRVSDIGNFSVIHNTVYLTGDVSSYKPNALMYHSCVRIENGATTTNGTISNNIFVNNIKTYDTTYGYNTYCMLYNNTPVNVKSDNNALWYSNKTSKADRGYTGRYNSTDRRSINDWRTAVGYDVNSLRDSVKFVSLSNAHIDPAKPAKIESAGANLALASDIDGDTRSTTPDIGADEGTFTMGPSVKTAEISIKPYTIPIFNPTATIMMQVKDAQGNNVTTGEEIVTFSTKDLTGYSLATIGATYDSLNGRYTAPITATRVGTPMWIYGAIGSELIVDTAMFVVTNTTPTDLTLSKSKVNEGNWTKKFVAKLSTVDPDAALGDKYTYSLVTGTGSADNASFLVSNDSLFITANVVYGTKPSYSIRLQTKDIGAATFQKQVVVIVNGAPTNIAISKTVVNDSTAKGTWTATLTGTDPNGASEVFTYAIVAGIGDTNNVSFKLAGNVLTLDSMFVYAKTKRIYLRVRVMDQDSLTFEKAFAINVNTRPTNIYLSPLTIAENAAKFSLIGNLNAQDPNGDPLTYNLPLGELDNASFSLSGGTKIVSNAVFDYETKKSYTIKVRGTDLGGLYIDKIFTIQVTNVYEAPADITLSNNTVMEKQLVGTFVGELSSIDPDSADVVAYKLVTGTGSTDNASFTIIGDSLVTNAVLDYSVKTKALIRVRVTDKGNKTFEKTFTIDINQNVGLKEVSDIIEIYPVPSNGLLNIKYKGTSDRPVVKITDINGKEVYNMVLTSDVSVLNLTSCAKGTYVLQIIEGKESYATTLVIE